ncbi:MAG: hypothetical protein LW636_09070 [Planctomycetaceae bacterium]|nr:hypothetical protein [Planctomycetaceae bacterium]
MLQEALDSKRRVRHRLIAALRRECPESGETLGRPQPPAGLSSEELDAIGNPLAEYLEATRHDSCCGRKA